MTNEQKSSNTMRTLAIACFVVLIVFLVWLAVTLVAALPGAFSSLASLAEGLQQDRAQDSITVANGNSIVNTSEDFTISWTDVNQDGVYTLFYTCVDGVSIDMRYPANNITTVPCGEVIKLGNNITSLQLITRSERSRFIDIDYQVGFMPAGEDDVAFATDSSFTVVNVNIPQSQSVAVTTKTETDTTSESDVADESIDTTETPATPPVTYSEPRTIATEIYALPSSDPNGFVDLAVTYLGVGRLTDANRYIPGTTIDVDTRGAFRFEVRNVGTKTSDDWTFAATLPTGQEYESDTQDELLPNEYSIVTLGFDTLDERGIQSFGAEVDVDEDRNRNNNDFTWAVHIVD
jgi:hypothetical protein